MYNSILAQVVKPEGTDNANFPALLEGDPNQGLDAAALVEEVTAMHAGAREDGVDVRCEIVGSLPPVYWDEEELRRVEDMARWCEKSKRRRSGATREPF